MGVLALLVLLTAVACEGRSGEASREPLLVEIPSSAPAPKVSSRPAEDRPPPRSSAEPPRSFADLASQADPAVVFVETQQAAFGGGRRSIGQGLGSGFVFDPGGLILTNNHVIENATRIDVVFTGERRQRARVVGADPPTDVAVLKVDAKEIPHLTLGDSSALRVGDWVVAIGNPFGLSHTVSAGIVSAKGRTRSDVEGLDPSGYYDFLQTDASINPGNSGGPLLDMSGMVVGINTAIKAQANNIGFAIPIDMVKELLPTLLEHGKVRRTAIGAVVASVRESDRARLGLRQREGAVVTQVVPGGPAERAGLEVDDVILMFDGEPAESPNRLRWLASMSEVGKQATLRIARGGRLFELTVTLEELPEPEPAKPRLDRFLFP